MFQTGFMENWQLPMQQYHNITDLDQRKNKGLHNLALVSLQIWQNKVEYNSKD